MKVSFYNIEAISIYSSLDRKFKLNPAIHLLFANCYYQLGDRFSSINYFNKALKIDPDIIESMDVFTYLRAEGGSVNQVEEYILSKQGLLIILLKRQPTRWKLWSLWPYCLT
jgi:tetratricopeptide (TPR) repeat protein